MSEEGLVLLLPLISGLSIPLGALLTTNKVFRTFCIEKEVDSFMLSFGGGALLAGIALVLVPRGVKNLPLGVVALTFLAGGVIAFLLASKMVRNKLSVAPFLSMMLDFIPEAIILGASVQTNLKTAYLLAVLIALQNMPEGFASFYEMTSAGMSKVKLWLLFTLSPFIGVLASLSGFTLFSLDSKYLSGFMLFCSGAILYFIFQDIAPSAKLYNRQLPSLGAVAGFLMGLMGFMMIH